MIPNNNSDAPQRFVGIFLQREEEDLGHEPEDAPRPSHPPDPTAYRRGRASRRASAGSQPLAGRGVSGVRGGFPGGDNLPPNPPRL